MISRKLIGMLLCLPVLSLQPINAQAETAAPQSKTPPSTTEVQFKRRPVETTVSEAQLNAAISALEKLAQQQIDEGVVPGLAISIVYKDKLMFAKGFGVREAGKIEKIDADTAFQLASCSKPLASTVVAALVGEGKITWDSKIMQLDPGFAMYEPWVTSQITIRDLFCHRSGLPDHAGDLLEDIGYDRAQILYRLRYQKPDSSFRAGYAYTNFGLTEGAIAAAKAYNMTWEDASDAKLYKPLGMNNTSSRFSDFIARPNKALGHVLVDGKWVHKYQREPDAQSPAGGASSSVNDMAQWMRLQIAGGKYGGKQIVSEKALTETHHPLMLTQFNPFNGLPGFYGLGLNVNYDQEGRLRLGHSGAFSRGVATNVSMIPDESLGICILTNAYPIGVAEALAMTFTDEALYGKSTHDWLPFFKQVFSNPAALGISESTDYSHAPALPSPALTNKAYTGTYENDFFGKLRVVDNSGELAVIIGPKEMTFPMQHYDRDIFVYNMDSEDTSGLSGMRFAIDANGKAANVLVENLNATGRGLFKRAQAAK